MQIKGVFASSSGPDPGAAGRPRRGVGAATGGASTRYTFSHRCEISAFACRDTARRGTTRRAPARRVTGSRALPPQRPRRTFGPGPIATDSIPPANYP
ncbi:hypothetical protein EVAR_74071_1 [Eumeta japonica]|uniref:Uncharacterized protein n=1 Tax=Eumeta variegata TaxID=151549 RepID=A0A4C1TLD1_EUMVA|nr:hypothetical protein EVAR_74071_1 [Eumeta japonica]